MTEALLLTLFAFAGFPIALSISRLPDAVLLSPLISSLACSAVWLVSMHLQLPSQLGWLITLGALNVFVFLSPRSRKAIFENSRARYHQFEWGVLLSAGAVFGLLGFRTAPPTAWDARYIWLARGQWYLNEPEALVELLSTDRVWAHPGYPPLVPATLSSVWGLVPSTDPSIGITVVTLMSVSALALAALLLARLVTAHQPSYGTLVPVSVVLLVGSLGADGLINDGYVDALLAALLLSVVINLASPGKRSVPTLLILLACSSLLKQEGAVFALALVVSALFVAPRRKIVMALATIISLGAIWQLSLRRWEVPSTSATAGAASRIREFVDPGGKVWSLVRELMATDYRGAILGLLALCLIPLVLLRLKSDPLARATRVVSVSGLLVSVIVISSYLLGDFRDDLDWWFPSSFSRVSAFPTLAAAASISLVVTKTLGERVRAPQAAAHARQVWVNRISRVFLQTRRG